MSRSELRRAASMLPQALLNSAPLKLPVHHSAIAGHCSISAILTVRCRSINRVPSAEKQDFESRSLQSRFGKFFRAVCTDKFRGVEMSLDAARMSACATILRGTRFC